jgi:hypothetical protein
VYTSAHACQYIHGFIHGIHEGRDVVDMHVEKPQTARLRLIPPTHTTGAVRKASEQHSLPSRASADFSRMDCGNKYFSRSRTTLGLAAYSDHRRRRCLGTVECTSFSFCLSHARRRPHLPQGVIECWQIRVSQRRSDLPTPLNLLDTRTPQIMHGVS